MIRKMVLLLDDALDDAFKCFVVMRLMIRSRC